MYRYFRLVETHYPKAERITLALDNWPVHFHPFVLEELAKRHSRIELAAVANLCAIDQPDRKGLGAAGQGCPQPT